MLLLSRASSIVFAALAGSRLRSWLAARGSGPSGRVRGQAAPRACTGERTRMQGVLLNCASGLAIGLSVMNS